MKSLKQETLDNIVAQTTKNKNVHGSVFHIESVDRSMSLYSASGNISSESQYYIASINKLIISFITLRLCQSKTINLDDKLSNYLPNEILKGLLVHNGKDYSGELKIRHLISHTSGLPCYLIDKGPDGKKNMDLILSGNDQSWPLEKVVSEVKKMKFKFIPESKGKASYSETNFRLLDRVLEVVTNKTIQDLLTDVFQELEMDNTFVLPSNSADNCAPIYFKQNQIEIKEYWISTNHDIASTAADQMKSQMPILLNVSYSFPSGGKLFDDFKTKIGGQARLYRIGNFKFSASIYGIYRRYENTLVRLQNFGSEMTGVIGYYKPKWFVAGEVGFDKAIVTHFKHSENFRNNFPEAQDGWYEPSTGGNFNYGVQTGYSFKNSDLTLTIGKFITQDF
ncbi:MAG: serine hydrolase, partial [Bacteroidia bacterium]|nr:serine hydrolase [Bacteroidia bacterium]